MTTRKTASFDILSRPFKYYSVKEELFWGYRLIETDINGLSRTIIMAEKEKAILDLLYLYSFYKTIDDFRDLRLNEHIMENEIDWERMHLYAERFKSKTMLKKAGLLQKIFQND